MARRPPTSIAQTAFVFAQATNKRRPSLVMANRVRMLADGNLAARFEGRRVEQQYLGAAPRRDEQRSPIRSDDADVRFRGQIVIAVVRVGAAAASAMLVNAVAAVVARWSRQDQRPARLYRSAQLTRSNPD